DEELIAQSDLVQDNRKDLTVLIQQYGIPFFDGNESNPPGATEQDMFRSARHKLEDFNIQRDEIEIQIKELVGKKDQELVEYAAGLDLPENQVTHYNTKHREAVEERRSMIARGFGENDPAVKAVEEKAKGALGYAEKEADSLKSVLGTKLELVNRQVERMEEMVSDRQSDTVDLSLKQHSYTQAKETYEESQEMLRAMKLARVRAGVGLDSNSASESKPAAPTQSAATALAAIDAEMEPASASLFGFASGGVLVFDWKTSSEDGGDRLWFNKGGQSPETWDKFISGDRAKGESDGAIAQTSTRSTSNRGSVNGKLPNLAKLPVTGKLFGETPDEATITGFSVEKGESGRVAGGDLETLESKIRPGSIALGNAIGGGLPEGSAPWDFELLDTSVDGKKVVGEFGNEDVVAENGRGANRLMKLRELFVSGNEGGKDRVSRREIPESPKQVRVTTKQVETLQKNIEELGFDWLDGGERSNQDFTGTVSRVAIPGIPTAGETVGNIVTAGNRSGGTDENKNLPLTWTAGANLGFDDGDQRFGEQEAVDGESLASKEMIRRKLTVADADEALMEGREAYAKGNYEGAVEKYQEAAALLPAGTATADRKKVITDHLADGSVALTQRYHRTGKYEEARQLLTEVEKSDPGNAAAIEGLEYLDDPIRNSPSLTYEHTKNVDKVRRNLYKGEELYDLGLYDKAEEEFKKVIRIDPYNKAARRWMERASAVKSDYYRAAYDSTRAEMLMEVDRAWELASSAKTDGDEVFAEKKGNESDPFTVDDGDDLGRRATMAKLNQIILPELNLENTTLEEALEFIQLRTVELDSTTLDSMHRGVEFSVRKPLVEVDESEEVDGFGAAADPNATIIKKLNLKNVPAGVALQYLADAAGMRYKIDADGAVTMLRLGDGEDSDIVQRRWEVPANFGTFITSAAEIGGDANVDADPFAPRNDDGAGGIKARQDITTRLKANGVTFGPNASASFISETNTLIIRNTPTNLELIDGIVSASTTAVKRQKAKEEQAEREALALKRESENFETSTAEKSDSTFSLNVSDVSFKLAKAALAAGNWPDASKVRPEEFVNALDYDDTKPSQSEKVACVIEQGAHPFMQQRNLMRIAMSTASLGRNASTPLRLTILLDQSGSMERADRAESVKRAFALLAAQLTANDEVTLVGFARTPRLLAERLKGDQAGKLAKIVANPLTEGGTNLEEALSSGLQLARQQFIEGAQNRIILITDGAANLGDALPGNLARQVEAMRKLGIAFDACGVGADGLNDEILSSLAKQGDGRYYFLDRPEDADEGFAKQIAGALRPAAKNVKVQILFNPDRVSKFKLYGFEKHKLKKEDFRNDAVDAAEMAAEESGVALYHFEAMPEGRGDIGTVSVRFFDMASKAMVERTWAIPYEADAALFSEAEPTLRLASVAGLFAEKLKGSPVGERVDLKRLRQEGELLKHAFDLQPRYHELKTMLQQAGD
ncbi:MAG: tetratricopeptide (TPR) repeat protein, partial [Akkermansiaceae bacterium]